MTNPNQSKTPVWAKLRSLLCRHQDDDERLATSKRKEHMVQDFQRNQKRQARNSQISNRQTILIVTDFFIYMNLLVRSADANANAMV